MSVKFLGRIPGRKEGAMQASIPASSGLVDRMIRAARLDLSLYNEVEADTNATGQAFTVVVIYAVASAIGAAIGAVFGNGAVIGALLGSLIGNLVGWVVWSFVCYFVGTRIFSGTATYGELLRTLGFANSPGVLEIFQFIPFLGGIIVLLVAVWRIVAGFFAVREALDISTGAAIGTILIGILAFIVVSLVISFIFAAIFLAAGAVTG